MNLASRRDFHLAVAQARKERTGLAAGKLGYAEQALLLYPHLLDKLHTPRQRAAALAWVRVHAYRQCGVFPDDEESMLEFIRRFGKTCQEMDYLAVATGWPALSRLFPGPSPTILEMNGLEPDRSQPYDVRNCYLPTLEGARVLLVSSMAELLVDRANTDTFERVWSNTGAPWFKPASVDALDFPFIYDEGVQAHHSSVWQIYDNVVERMQSTEFDVALIAAAGLGSPIALAAKRLGAIGISLGGHLQVLFGVHGKRWQEDAAWSSLYFNDAWVTPPTSLRPDNSRGLADDGAYW